MKLNNKGFSLVELLLAVVISTVVFGAITALIAFSSRSMKETNARVEVQNQAKDAMNHIESYTLEAEVAFWDKLNRYLILFYDEKDGEKMVKELNKGGLEKTDAMKKIKDLSSKTYVYWFKNNDGTDAIGGDYSVYFGQCSGGAIPGASATPVPAPTLVPGATQSPSSGTVSMPSLLDVSEISSINMDDSKLRNYLLADDVVEFDCKVSENEASRKSVVDVKLRFNDDISPEYSCEKRIYMRNQ